MIGNDLSAQLSKIPYFEKLNPQHLSCINEAAIIRTFEEGQQVFLEGDRSFYGPSLDCMEYLDPDTNKRMDFTTDHCRITASLTDSLPNFDWSMVIGMASDVPPEISDRVIVRQALTHSQKPLVFCTHSVENEKDVLEMALLVCVILTFFIFYKNYPLKTVSISTPR